MREIVIGYISPVILVFYVDFYMLLSNLLSGAIFFFLKFRMQKYKGKGDTPYHVSKTVQKDITFQRERLRLSHNSKWEIILV